MNRHDSDQAKWLILADVLGLAIIVPFAVFVGGCELARRGVLSAARKLRRVEQEAVADWNLAIGGMATNEQIDSLPEEEQCA